MDYKKLHEDTITNLQQMVNSGKIAVKTACGICADFVPESENERIRKELIKGISKTRPNTLFLDTNVTREKALAWLEKQGEQKPVFEMKTPEESLSIDSDTYNKIVDECIYGEQKPADKVEPKFKVDDWVIYDDNIYQIHNISLEKYYECLKIDGTVHTFNFEYIDSKSHLWAIQDAKEGDVLTYVTDEGDLWIMIYWSLYELYEGHVHYHALLVNDDFSDKGTCCICIDNLKPATKEQRNLLFQKMHEACYEWDAEKKELRKIVTPIYNIGDRVRYKGHACDGVIKEITDTDYICGNAKLPISTQDKLELVEQKLVWSEEDELHIRELESLVKQVWATAERENDKETIHKMSDLSFFLKTLKPQPKQEWNEEDEERLQSCLKILQAKGIMGVTETVNSKWLKSLKDRVQLKHAEWSEEDYNEIETIACHLDNIDNEGMAEVLRNIRDKYYSQSTWKPSDWQIKVCKEVYADILSAKGFDLGTVNGELNRLEEELKKLREE